MQSFWLKIDQINPKKLHYWIVALGMLTAAWIQYIQHGWINPDSVLYLEQARLITNGEWQAAYRVFNWPFYGACIAGVHLITTASIHLSAQILNVVFFGVATSSFLSIIRLANGENRTMLAGTLLLLSSPYIVADVLEMLMRDEGFWAFFLSSLVFFIRFKQLYRLKDALLWQICIIFATLFRIEAICYLLALPISLLFMQHFNWHTRFKNLANSYSILFIAALPIGFMLLFNSHLSMKDFGRLQEIFTLNLFQELTENLQLKAKLMSDQVLGKFLNEFAVTGLLLTFTYVVVYKTTYATGIIATIFAGLTLKNLHALLEKNSFLVLKTVAVIAVISMFLITVKVFVLSGRYAVALSWILMILAAFYIAYLSTQLSKKARLLTLAICLILMAGFIKNILPKRAGYNYMQDAVAWMVTTNKAKQAVFYNEPRMRYYANAPFLGTGYDSWPRVTEAISNQSINKYEWLMISLSHKEPDKALYLQKNLKQYYLMKSFYSEKAKHEIVIYRKKSTQN